MFHTYSVRPRSCKMSEEETKKLGLNPCAKEFKPSFSVVTVERVVVTNNCQKPQSHGRKGIKYLRRWFDDNIHKWVKVPLPPFRVILLRFCDKTTLMIQNIPNRLRKMLIQLLDEHCEEQNKVILGLKINPPTPLSEYDFVYLPIDFKSNLNKGYAFVNFTTDAGAFRFFRSFDNHKWNLFDSKKICEIDFAEIQGRENLVERFMKSNFICDTKAYLPVQFLPPRNGSSQTTIGTVVGRRSVPLQNCLKKGNNQQFAPSKHCLKIWTRLGSRTRLDQNRPPRQFMAVRQTPQSSAEING